MTDLELDNNVTPVNLSISNLVSTPVSLPLSNKADTILVPRAAKFKQSLKSGTMLVKSRSTGELSTLNIADQVQVCSDSILSNYVVRDKRVEPKQNYTKIDPSVVNIHAHKGPDEQPDNGGGVGGMAL